MANFQPVIALCLMNEAIELYEHDEDGERRVLRRGPTKDWILEKTRLWPDQVHPFYQHLQEKDPAKFKEMFRMQPGTFEELFARPDRPSH